MFLRNKNNSQSEVSNNMNAAVKKTAPSVISTGTNILGNIISDGAIDIDGRLEGNVKGEQVTVRSNGKISGDIVAHSVHIYGEVHGIIRAHDVHLYATANVSGVIVHHSMSVEEGAFIEAKFKRVNGAINYNFGDVEEPDNNDVEGSGLIESAPAFVGNATLRLIG
jgi:cytoskeletal protein CcmA (bactofilin family)